MKKAPEPQIRKLESEPLWQDANVVAAHIYKMLPGFPEEEKWSSAARLRSATLDMLFNISSALSASVSSEMEWSAARKAVGALRTAYPFVAKQGFLELEPDIMVRIEKMIADMEKEVILSHKAADDANEAELDYWRERYKLWQKTNEK